MSTVGFHVLYSNHRAVQAQGCVHNIVYLLGQMLWCVRTMHANKLQITQSMVCWIYPELERKSVLFCSVICWSLFLLALCKEANQKFRADTTRIPWKLANAQHQPLGWQGAAPFDNASTQCQSPSQIDSPDTFLIKEQISKELSLLTLVTAAKGALLQGSWSTSTPCHLLSFHPS